MLKKIDKIDTKSKIFQMEINCQTFNHVFRKWNESEVNVHKWLLLLLIMNHSFGKMKKKSENKQIEDLQSKEMVYDMMMYIYWEFFFYQGCEQFRNWIELIAKFFN